MIQSTRACPLARNSSRSSGPEIVSALTVAADVAYGFLEQTENLSGFVVAPGLVLGVDEIAVHRDIEHSLRSGGQRQPFNNVLIVREKIFCCAHGVARIVSRNAIFDVNDMSHDVEVIGLCCCRA